MKSKNVDINKMNIRDYITTGIFVVLYFVVYTIVGTPLGMSAIGNVFIFGVCSLVWGTVFMLLYSKVNKNGVVLTMSTLLALLILIVFWGISIFIFIGGIVGEYIWRKCDKKKYTTMTICYTIQILSWNLGSFITLIFLKDLYLNSIGGYADMFEVVYNLITGPLFIVGIFSTVIGCVIGSYIGKKILRKHFKKAGIV